MRRKRKRGKKITANSSSSKETERVDFHGWIDGFCELTGLQHGGRRANANNDNINVWWIVERTFDR